MGRGGRRAGVCVSEWSADVVRPRESRAVDEPTRSAHVVSNGLRTPVARLGALRSDTRSQVAAPAVRRSDSVSVALAECSVLSRRARALALATKATGALETVFKCTLQQPAGSWCDHASRAGSSITHSRVSRGAGTRTNTRTHSKTRIIKNACELPTSVRSCASGRAITEHAEATEPRAHSAWVR